MTLGENKNALERNYGTRNYWKSYSKGILAKKRPWLSEVKTALIGLETACRAGDSEAIRLKDKLNNMKKNDTKRHTQ
jgi:hypothetical protein